jgi:hypothetical protein
MLTACSGCNAKMIGGWDVGYVPRVGVPDAVPSMDSGHILTAPPPAFPPPLGLPPAPISADSTRYPRVWT